MQPRRSQRGTAQLNYFEDGLAPSLYGFDPDCLYDSDCSASQEENASGNLNNDDSDYSVSQEEHASGDLSSDDSKEASESDIDSEKRITLQYVKRRAEVARSNRSVAQISKEKPKKARASIKHRASYPLPPSFRAKRSTFGTTTGNSEGRTPSKSNKRKMNVTIRHYPKRVNPKIPSIQTPRPSSSLAKRLRIKLQRTREALNQSNARCNKLQTRLNTARTNAVHSANAHAARQQDACNLVGELLHKLEETQDRMRNDIHSMKTGMRGAFAEMNRRTIWDQDSANDGQNSDNADERSGDEEARDGADRDIKDEDQSVDESD